MWRFVRRCLGVMIACGGLTACMRAESSDVALEAESLGMAHLQNILVLDGRPSSCSGVKMDVQYGGYSFFSFSATLGQSDEAREYVACCGGPRGCVIRRK
ncbi:hypothetical protein HY480_01290 [Candidatus Uhrbacteria bacterium]|nr:hypothetical protein [Candidatus Uhrbacteria bacterium]